MDNNRLLTQPRVGFKIIASVLTLALMTACHKNDNTKEESLPIEIVSLPLPPTAPSTDIGACTITINPNESGCLDPTRRGVDGVRTFSIDGNHVFVSIRYAGAPDAPEPSNIYSGGQLILVKTDGSTFANGDGWKCVTCGVPDANKVSINNPDDNTYPEAFTDGMRVKMGSNILDCSPHLITSPGCTPESTHIYPIQSPFPSGLSNGIMRELRLHPDNVHLGWNQLFLSTDFTAASQFGVFGRLNFLANPASGVPRYEITDVSFLLSPNLGESGRFIGIQAPGELLVNSPMGVVGEFRGFTPDGKSTLGIGTQDSFNYDIFATDLQTGLSTRLSKDPAYTDPVNISPDGKSMVIMDGRVTDDTGYPGGNPAGTDGRLYFASAAVGVPPLIDLAITEAIAGLYTNSSRGSFLQPYLIELDGSNDNDIHDGQLLNAGGDPSPGSDSISDPLWLGGADPAWSPDGTAVVYYQRRGCNAGEMCPESTEPGGRHSRLLMARLNGRNPIESPLVVEPVPDAVPWGMPYIQGDPLPPKRQTVPAGEYTLYGEQGWATVIISEGPSRFHADDVEVESVAVEYFDYSPDGENFISGTEKGSRVTTPYVSNALTWHSDLTFSGAHTGTRKTSEPDGFVVTNGFLGSDATFSGSMTTILDGMTFNSPTN